MICKVEFAKKLYLLAADQGDVNAQYNLAYMFVQGLGVKQDLSKALKWAQLASDQGDEMAMSLRDFCVNKLRE